MAADAPTTTTPKERVGTYLYFCSLYFVAVGALYLWGYWSSFNVNILEYLSLADVVKSTAYPIATGLVLTFFGAAIGEAWASDRASDSKYLYTSRLGKFIRKHSRPITIVYSLLTFYFALLGPVWKWHVLPVLFAMFLYPIARQVGFLSKTLPHEGARSILIFLLAIMPPLAYGRGRLDADAIEQGSTFEYVITAVEGLAVPSNATPQQRVRFVGHSGDFVFLFEPTTKTLVITKFSESKPLALRHFGRTATPWYLPEPPTFASRVNESASEPTRSPSAASGAPAQP